MHWWRRCCTGQRHGTAATELGEDWAICVEQQIGQRHVDHKWLLSTHLRNNLRAAYLITCPAHIMFISCAPPPVRHSTPPRDPRPRPTNPSQSQTSPTYPPTASVSASNRVAHSGAEVELSKGSAAPASCMAHSSTMVHFTSTKTPPFSLWDATTPLRNTQAQRSEQGTERE